MFRCPYRLVRNSKPPAPRDPPRKEAGGSRSSPSSSKTRQNTPSDVPYKFIIRPPHDHANLRLKFTPLEMKIKGEDKKSPSDETSVEFTGNRFPALGSAQNFRYWKEKGLNKLERRVFPIKVPAFRTLNPVMREYIFFLHTWDPARFTIERIAERYKLKEATVQKVVKEFSTQLWLKESGLVGKKIGVSKQMTKESKIMQAKEYHFSKQVGWDEMGDGEQREEHEDVEFKGFRNTQDWVRRQQVEVEMMSAYPMQAKRNPMPKRVDVDITVDEVKQPFNECLSSANYRIINWIDPNDKIVF